MKTTNLSLCYKMGGRMEYSRRGHISGRKSPTKGNTVLHYGKCSRECFWNLTPFKSQDIKAFAALILTI